MSKKLPNKPPLILLLCSMTFSMTLSSCGDTLSDLATGGSEANSSTNPTTGLTEDTSKFFSVFEGLDPAKDIDFSVAVFSFLSKDNLNVTNLKVKAFTPVAAGAKILDDSSIQFTQGFTSNVKLTETLFCGKFVLKQLKILFCPGSVAPSDPGSTKALSLLAQTTTTSKTLVASSKDIVVAGKSIGGLDNMDELIALIETSGTLKKDTEAEGTDNVSTTFESTSGQKLEDEVKTATASATQLGTLSSVSEIKSLTLSTGTNYTVGALTPVGSSGYTGNTTIQLLTSLSDAAGGNLFSIIEVTSPSSIAAGISTNLNTSLLGDTNNPSYSRILTSANGQDIYVLGDYFNQNLNLGFVTLSHIAYQSGALRKGSLYGSNNPSSLSKNDISMTRENSLVAKDVIPGDNNTLLLLSGSSNSLSEMAIQTVRNSDGVDSTTIAAEIENGSFSVIHIVPRFDTQGNRVVKDTSNHMYIAVDQLPSSKFGVIDCDSTSFACAYEFQISQSAIQARTDKTVTSHQLRYVTEANQFVGQYLSVIETGYDLNTTPFYSYSFLTVVNGEIGSQVRHNFGANELPLAVYGSAQVASSKAYAYVLVKNTSNNTLSLRVLELAFQ